MYALDIFSNIQWRIHSKPTVTSSLEGQTLRNANGRR